MPGLGKRLLTAGVVLPPVLLAIYFGPKLMAVLLAAFALWGAREMVRLHRVRGLQVPAWLPGAGALILIVSYSGWIGIGVAAGLLLVVLVGIITELFRRNGSMLSGLPVVVLGSVYLGLLPAHLLRFYDLGRVGRPDPWPVYYALLLIWGCDTAAYGIGSILGRHKLWPRVSPSKSWEGAAAGLVGSVLLAVAFGRWVPGLSLGAQIGAGILVGVASQLGDLAESLMKREAATKDSGGFFPGHGGVLDRLDSIILAAPVLYYWLRWTLRVS